MKSIDPNVTAPNDFREALALLEQKLRDCEDSASLIDGLLEGTAQFYGADRAYIIEADWELGIGLNTYDAEKMALSLRGNQYTSSNESACDQIGHKQNSPRTRKRIAEETNTSEGYVKRADQYAKGVDAAEEVLPGIKNELLLGKYKPKESDVAVVARASPEERREKAEQLRVIPEKKPKADKGSTKNGTKHSRQDYVEIDKSYEDMKASKRVTEDSALASLRYTARNMVETCDVLFTNFPGLLEKPNLTSVSPTSRRSVSVTATIMSLTDSIRSRRVNI